MTFTAPRTLSVPSDEPYPVVRIRFDLDGRANLGLCYYVPTDPDHLAAFRDNVVMLRETVKANFRQPGFFDAITTCEAASRETKGPLVRADWSKNDMLNGAGVDIILPIPILTQDCDIQRVSCYHIRGRKSCLLVRDSAEDIVMAWRANHENGKLFWNKFSPTDYSRLIAADAAVRGTNKSEVPPQCVSLKPATLFDMIEDRLCDHGDPDPLPAKSETKSDKRNRTSPRAFWDKYFGYTPIP